MAGDVRCFDCDMTANGICSAHREENRETERARSLDDEMLERTLRAALAAGGRVAALQAEARRRFAGMLGLPASLLTDREEETT